MEINQSVISNIISDYLEMQNYDKEAIDSVLADDRFAEALANISEDVEFCVEDYIKYPFNNELSLSKILCEEVFPNFTAEIEEAFINYDMEHDPYKEEEL